MNNNFQSDVVDFEDIFENGNGKSYLDNGPSNNNQEDDIYEDDGIQTLTPNLATANNRGVVSPKIKVGVNVTSPTNANLEKGGAEMKRDKSIDTDFFYGINKNLYKIDEKTAQLPKTGTDFVLLPHNPDFIDVLDGDFEPFYIPKQTILEDTLRHEAEKICFQDMLMNKVVYDCVDNAWSAQKTSDNITPQDFGIDTMPYYIPKNKDDTTLVFESRFECGNLRRAIQINEYEYNLILKPDYFTRGHTQWYYFSVANTRKNKEYRFNIINMMKPDSLYNQGMKPLAYSEITAKSKKKGWFRDGYDVCYYQNNLKRKNAGFYYTLTFVIKFEHDFDTIYLTHCYPYTFSRLNNFLKTLEGKPNMANKMRRKPLCATIANNNCEMVIITNFQQSVESSQEKKSIIISSRVHPGETNSSFVMENIIDFLTGSSLEAQILRDNFIFRIVPMLNIDGVINGNYRCNLAGVDLNRQWMDPSKKLHPEIHHTKAMIRKVKEERDVLVYCDIHGHSRKHNIFFYGCSGKDPKRREHVMPLLMSKNCEVFSYKDCCFALQKDREASARITLWRELNILNCFTLEISFSGSDQGKYQFIHFNLDIFKEIATNFCQTLLDMCDPDQKKAKGVIEEIDQMIAKNQFKNDTIQAGGEPSEDEDSDYSNDDLPIEVDMSPKLLNPKGAGGGKLDEGLSPSLKSPVPPDMMGIGDKDRNASKKKKIVMKKKA